MQKGSNNADFFLLPARRLITAKGGGSMCLLVGRGEAWGEAWWYTPKAFLSRQDGGHPLHTPFSSPLGPETLSCSLKALRSAWCGYTGEGAHQPLPVASSGRAFSEREEDFVSRVPKPKCLQKCSHIISESHSSDLALQIGAVASRWQRRAVWLEASRTRRQF